ncbi:vacuolar sorting protein VPS33/slp1 [Podochytrium sp. JEL0797]|nr:vacuolar sorting protein VPS33/slp1 [Podochytrium sp. JEL0797]
MQQPLVSRPAASIDTQPKQQHAFHHSLQQHQRNHRSSSPTPAATNNFAAADQPFFDLHEQVQSVAREGIPDLKDKMHSLDVHTNTLRSILGIRDATATAASMGGGGGASMSAGGSGERFRESTYSTGPLAYEPRRSVMGVAPAEYAEKKNGVVGSMKAGQQAGTGGLVRSHDNRNSGVEGGVKTATVTRGGGRGGGGIVSEEVITSVKGGSSKWKVLVVDGLARKVINSCIKTSDILELNVTIVEKLELRRTPFPEYDAVYLLAPTPESVELLLQDYTQGRPPYAAAHLFFISALSDTLFEKIQKSPIQRHVKTLKELNMDFLALEPQAFSLDLPTALPSIINAQTPSHLNYELAPVAKRLVSVLATLGEYPYIRYYTPPTPTITPNSTNTPLIEKFATLVQDELDELARIDKSFPPPSNYPRAILLLVDRGVDVVSPLLHEFSYQALVNDALTLEDGNKIVNKADEGKLTTLDDNCKLWDSQKYNHIADVLQFLAEGVKKFSTENKAANFASGNGRSGDQIADLKDTLNALPEYQELKAKFSLHTDICQNIMAIFSKYNLQSLSTVEQELVTGEDSDFKPPKNISAQVVALLSNPKICHEDKLRLLMLHIITAEGLPDSERQQLFDLVKLSRDEYQAVTNLSMLGVRLSESIVKRGDKANPYMPSVLKGGRGRVKAVKFDNSRYIPIIKHILEDQTRNTMDPLVFPWVKEPPPGYSRPLPSAARVALAARPSSGYDYDENSTGIQRTKASWATSRAAAAAAASNTPTTLSRANSAKDPMTALLGPSVRAPLDANLLRGNGPRVILFVLGGMTYSEMRAANEVMVENQREVLIGSTHVVNPHTFLDTLKGLHRRGGNVGGTVVVSPYDPAPEKVVVPVKERLAASSRGGGGRRGEEDGPMRVQKSKSEGRIVDRSYRDEERGGGVPVRSGSGREGVPVRGGGGTATRSASHRDEPPSVTSSPRYRDDERGNASRSGYRDDRDDRGAPSSRGYGGDGRGGARGGDRYGSEPVLNTRSRSRDEREQRGGGGSMARRGGDELSDRMERVNLEQPVKKKNWFGFGKK